MYRFLWSILSALVVAVGLSATQGGDIRNARVKKLDLDAKILTLTIDGKDRDFLLTEKTMVLDAKDKGFKERFQGVKEGAEVMFRSAMQDGKEVIIGLKLVPPPQPPADTSKLVPLTELKGEYQGFKGGLYPDGTNARPPDHDLAGLALARLVFPVDAEGRPSADGKIVLMSVGMSNTGQASAGFQKVLAKDKDKNPRVLFVNGSMGSMTAAAIQNPDDKKTGTKYWTYVDQQLKDAGVTRDQVQAIWIKEADAGPTEGFPKYAQKLQAELTKIVQLLPGRFPNLKLVYLSSRTYAGWANKPLNPEPYAYESGFSVKWLIEQQIKGDKDLNFDPKKGPVKAPWLSWGPYFWANGTSKRADGFYWEQKDFADDGTHLSASGQVKVGQLMLDFFKSDGTARLWFVKGN
jgi:Cu/Ag efflux protein CusF